MTNDGLRGELSHVLDGLRNIHMHAELHHLSVVQADFINTQIIYDMETAILEIIIYLLLLSYTVQGTSVDGPVVVV